MRITKDNLIEYLVNQMFISVNSNLTYKDCLIIGEDWLNKVEWTIEQQSDFRKEVLIPTISKVLRIPKYKGKRSADMEASWFLLGYGLKIKKDDRINIKIK